MDEDEGDLAAHKTELRMGYPSLIEFFEGPYDGVLLQPHEELAYDVCRRDFGESHVIPFGNLPTNFDPVDTDRMILASQALGAAYYVQDEITKKWTFREMVWSPQDEDSE